MAAANRHSTIVAWVRVVLPLLAIGLMSTLFLFSGSPDPEDALPFADEDVGQMAEDQQLSQPRFAGTLEDGREVTLVANAASPSTEGPNVILVDGVEARVALSAVDYLILNAEDGSVDISRQTAELMGDVRISTSQGYRLNSGLMTVGLAEMTIVSPGAITATGPGLDLDAGAMEVTETDGTMVLSFTGGVRLLYGGWE